MLAFIRKTIGINPDTEEQCNCCSGETRKRGREEKHRERLVKIEGMTCEGCVQSITTALDAVAGVDVCAVKVGEATISTCLAGPEQVLELEQSIIQAVNRAGYKVHSIVPK